MKRDGIQTAIESLVRCEACGHGIGFHDGTGCCECVCDATREDVVEGALAAARDEIRDLWSAPSTRQPETTSAAR